MGLFCVCECVSTLSSIQFEPFYVFWICVWVFFVLFCFNSRYTGLLFGSYYRVIVMFLVVEFYDFCFFSLFPCLQEKWISSIVSECELFCCFVWNRRFCLRLRSTERNVYPLFYYAQLRAIFLFLFRLIVLKDDLYLRIQNLG